MLKALVVLVLGPDLCDRDTNFLFGGIITENVATVEARVSVAENLEEDGVTIGFTGDQGSGRMMEGDSTKLLEESSQLIGPLGIERR